MTEALDLELTEADVDRELVRRGGLAAFLELAWPVVEGTFPPFVSSPHIKLVCDHLEAVTRGELLRLVVNIPPGMSKSSLVSVFWPVWHWIQFPYARVMAVSFDQQLSLRDAEKSRKLLGSDWFQERWGDKVKLAIKAGKGAKQANQAKSFYYTNAMGFRMSTMFGGKATGNHADVQIVDDPIKPSTIQGGGDTARKALEKVHVTWKETFGSRTRGKVARVLIMQRLHADDLAARCIAEGYVPLVLPMEYDPEKHCKTPWGEDWRTQKGELLCPERVGKGDATAVAQAKKDLGSRGYAAQYQQDPTPDGGAIFKREWFKQRWSYIPAGAVWWQSWDCTFKDTGDSDFVVGQVWAKSGDDYFHVYQARGRWSFTETCNWIKRVTAMWPQTSYEVLVEDKANGTAVIDTLRAQIPGLQAVEPLGGKTARANAVSPVWESGHVYYPEDEGENWEGGNLEELISEYVKFPLGANDDQVDGGTQAVAHKMPKEQDRYGLLAKALAPPSVALPAAAARYVVRPGDVLVKTETGHELEAFAAKAGFGMIAHVEGLTYAVHAPGREDVVRQAVVRYGLGTLA